MGETIINAVAQNGIKEVVITGIHVASYGKDFKNNYKETWNQLSKQQQEDIIADRVADIVDEKLSNIEKIIRDSESKSEIQNAIKNIRIKTKK